MKRLNVFILPIIGLLTISLTAFTRSGGKHDLTPVTNCYGSVTVQFTAFRTPVNIVSNSNISCATAMNYVGGKVSSASNFFGIIDCDEVEEVFCCAQLVVDATPCPAQTRLKFVDVGGVLRVNQFAKIDAIYCKSVEF